MKRCLPIQPLQGVCYGRDMCMQRLRVHSPWQPVTVDSGSILLPCWPVTDLSMRVSEHCIKIANSGVCRKHRQKRNVTLIMLEAILQWLNLIFFVLPNAFLVANPCYLIADVWYWFGFVRWTCWNSVSCLCLCMAVATCCANAEVAGVKWCSALLY